MHAGIHPDEEGLCYEDRLPVGWEPGPDDGYRRAHLLASNENLMHLVDALEGHAADADERSGASPELQRLERKIDVLLAMVGRIHAKSIALPAATDMALYANGLAWVVTEASPLQAGDSGYLSLYLDPALPDPLYLPGRIERVEQDDEGHRWAFLRFDALGETVQDAIERLIFRHHRRAVAMAKSIKQKK